MIGLQEAAAGGNQGCAETGCGCGCLSGLLAMIASAGLLVLLPAVLVVALVVLGAWLYWKRKDRDRREGS